MAAHSSEELNIESTIYLCTDNPEPKCAGGWCDLSINEDCQICKDGYSTSADISNNLNLNIHPISIFNNKYFNSICIIFFIIVTFIFMSIFYYINNRGDYQKIIDYHKV